MALCGIAASSSPVSAAASSSPVSTIRIILPLIGLGFAVIVNAAGWFFGLLSIKAYVERLSGDRSRGGCDAAGGNCKRPAAIFPRWPGAGPPSPNNLKDSSGDRRAPVEWQLCRGRCLLRVRKPTQEQTYRRRYSASAARAHPHLTWVVSPN